MTSKTTRAKPAKATPAQAEGNNSGTNSGNQSQDKSPAEQLTAIRQLLHGEELATLRGVIDDLKQDMQHRFTELQKSLEKTAASLASDMNAKIEDLSNHLENLHKQHLQREDDLSADIDDLRHRLGQAQDESGQADERLSAEFHSEVERLARELEKKHNQTMAELEKTSSELSSNKADRKTLANLLASMASNLTTDELE